jgi:hypothetical protein
MSRYLMNAAVIPHGCAGTFTYRLATVEDLIAFVQAGAVINTIAYQESLDWVAALTGVTFQVSRDLYPLQPGDEAFVIRRLGRNPNTWKPGLLRCEMPPPAKPTHQRGEKRAALRQARTRKKA